MLRLFVGIELPGTFRERLSVLAAGLPGARWMAPETYHVTLVFLGELDEGAAEQVHDELSIVRGKAFPLEISGVGSFESKGRLRALWAGVELSEPLAVLQGRVAAACVRAGVDIEKRKFKPHITLARFSEQPSKAKLGEWLANHSLLRLQPLAVTTFVLFQSHLGREGAQYEVLERYMLEA